MSYNKYRRYGVTPCIVLGGYMTQLERCLYRQAELAVKANKEIEALETVRGLKSKQLFVFYCMVIKSRNKMLEDK